MYKLLLSWRYLRTRFIALASIISVTLGVATLIVVNSVMSGFVFEMKSRLHGILSDVEVAAPLLGQINDPAAHMQIIRDELGDDIESMTAVVRNPALLTFDVNGRQWTQQVMLLGIDDTTFGGVTDFQPYLQNDNKRTDFTFDLEETGYPQWLPDAGWEYRRERERRRKSFEKMQAEQQALYDLAAEKYLAQTESSTGEISARPAYALPSADERAYAGSFEPSADTDDFDVRQVSWSTTSPEDSGNANASQPTDDDADASDARFSESDFEGDFQFVPLPVSPPDFEKIHAKMTGQPATSVTLAPTHTSLDGTESFRKFTPYDPHAPFRKQPTAEEFFDAEKDQHTGIILGLAIAQRKTMDEAGELKDFYMVRPGDDVQIMFPTVGATAKPVSQECTVVDYYSSNMHEYDSSFAFVPIRELQRIRGMIDPMTGDASVSTIQIKLKEDADLDAARDKLLARFPPQAYPYDIHTWQDTQRPLLSAVHMELTILNLLLFMIIAVAGFGILATFFMIVVEKTKDIGVLKALGAPSRGVMSIFLTYGMALGLVGTGAGIVIGLLFVRYINQIAELVQIVTGQEVFDPAIYYFSEIPTIVSPLMVCWVGLGAIAIAVLAAVLPSMRAARLHPVEALRYE